MAVITKPELPPKAGYVEVEVDGRRTYKNAVTGVLIEDETPELTAEELIDIMLGVASDE